MSSHNFMSYTGNIINDIIEIKKKIDSLLKMWRIPYVLNVGNICTCEHAHDHQGSLY